MVTGIGKFHTLSYDDVNKQGKRRELLRGQYNTERNTRPYINRPLTRRV